jgi:hypothetical protein
MITKELSQSFVHFIITRIIKLLFLLADLVSCGWPRGLWFEKHFGFELLQKIEYLVLSIDPDSSLESWNRMVYVSIIK